MPSPDPAQSPPSNALCAAADVLATVAGPAWIASTASGTRLFETVNADLARALLRTRNSLLNRSVQTAFPFVPPCRLHLPALTLPPSEGLIGVGRTAQWVRVHETHLRTEPHLWLGTAQFVPVDCAALGISGASEASIDLLGALVDAASRDGAVCLYGEPGTGHDVFARFLTMLATGDAEGVVRLRGGALRPSHTQQLPPNARFVIVADLQDATHDVQHALFRELRRRPLARLIATTTEDPRRLTRTGRLTAEALELLAGRTVRLPPLRERIEDVPFIARERVRASVSPARFGLGISHRSEERLLCHRWPDNLPELARVVDSGLRRCLGPVVELRPTWSVEQTPTVQTLDQALREHIVAALDATGWQVEGETGAAAALGLAPSTLRSKMQRYRITRPK